MGLAVSSACRDWSEATRDERILAHYCLFSFFKLCEQGWWPNRYVAYSPAFQKFLACSTEPRTSALQLNFGKDNSSHGGFSRSAVSSLTGVQRRYIMTIFKPARFASFAALAIMRAGSQDGKHPAPARINIVIRLGNSSRFMLSMVHERFP